MTWTKHLKMGDRIAIMKDGKLLQLDTPEKLLHEPAHGFVEEFIGKHRIIQNPELMPVTDIMSESVVTSLPQSSPEKALITYPAAKNYKPYYCR